MSQLPVHIWVLPTIHHVLALEAPLKAAGIWFDQLPKPASISSDCGVVLATLCADESRVLAVLQKEAKAGWTGPFDYHSSTVRYSVTKRSRSTTKATPVPGPDGQ